MRKNCGMWQRGQFRLSTGTLLQGGWTTLALQGWGWASFSLQSQVPILTLDHAESQCIISTAVCLHPLNHGIWPLLGNTEVSSWYGEQIYTALKSDPAISERVLAVIQPLNGVNNVPWKKTLKVRPCLVNAMLTPLVSVRYTLILAVFSSGITLKWWRATVKH